MDVPSFLARIGFVSDALANEKVAQSFDAFAEEVVERLRAMCGVLPFACFGRFFWLAHELVLERVGGGFKAV